MHNQLLRNCQLCPRACRVDRLAGQTGFCQAGMQPRLGLVSLHHWEEPCISGVNGSGTVFFSHCNLRCLFCQNHTISQANAGKEIPISRLAEIFLEQQQRGAHNVNLVTPTHYAPQIAEALAIAKDNGLVIPVVYNTNAYESIEVIHMLRGLVDIYLPDLKYYNNMYAQDYSLAPDYFIHATKAIEVMVKQIGQPVFDAAGIMQRGVIIRHLALPGSVDDSKVIIRYIHATYGRTVLISLMNQYTPMHKALQHKILAQQLSDADYEELVEYAIALGIEDGFIQEGGAVSESFVPLFNGAGV